MQTDTPPVSLEAEEYVVGACLIGSPQVTESAAEIVSRKHFYRQSLGVIFETCCSVARTGHSPDAVIVADELRKTGDIQDVGGYTKLIELGTIVPAVSNVERYARIVLSMYNAREEFYIGQMIHKVAHNGGIMNSPELVERLQRVLSNHDMAEPIAALDLHDLLSNPTPVIPWTWNDWIGLHDLAMMVGDPGVGKSYLSLALGLAIRRGDEFLGEATTQGRVGIIDLENPLSEIHVRLHSLGLSSDDTDGLVYVHSPELSIGRAEGMASVDRVVEEHALDFLVLDSFRRLAPGVNENDSGEISQIMTPLRMISQTHGVTILLLHHPRKRGEGPVEPSQMGRGSGDFLASCDTQLYLRGRAGHANEFTIEHAKNRHGYDHPALAVRIERDEDTGLTEMISAGELATTDDKVEQTLDRVLSMLAERDVPASRKEITMAIGSRDSRMLNRALALGVQRDVLVDRKGKGRASLFMLSSRDLKLEDDDEFPF